MSNEQDKVVKVKSIADLDISPEKTILLEPNTTYILEAPINLGDRDPEIALFKFKDN